MSSHGMRHANSEGLLREHRARRQHEELAYLTCSSSAADDSSSDMDSQYSFSDSSSSYDVHLKRVAYPHPSSLVVAPGRLAPANFASVVSEQIYRCAYPREENYDFIRSLELKTIITLVDKPVAPAYAKFLKTAGIRHVVCPITPNKGDSDRTTFEQIAAALTLVMDPHAHPVLFHCNSGKHRSGCLTAAFRKCLGVGIDAVLDEYLRHAGEKARALDVAFIRAFDERQFVCDVRRGMLAVGGEAPPDVEPVIRPLSAPGKMSRASV